MKGKSIVLTILLAASLGSVIWSYSQQISPRIADTIFVGREPRAVAVHPEEDLAYVTLKGESRVAVIDTRTNVLKESISVGKHPSQVVITPDGRFLYVSLPWLDRVAVVDTERNEVTARIGVGDVPGGMAVTPDGEFVYVSNNRGGSVSVIKTAERHYDVPKVVTTIRDIDYPRGICTSPDGGRVYVASSVEGINSVTVIDADTNTVTTTFTVDDATTDCVVTPDGRFLYVSMDPHERAKPGAVAVVSTATNRVVESIEIGKAGFEEYVSRGMGGIDITSDGNFTFVVNTEENSVAVIDTQINEVVGMVGTTMFGSEPEGLAITPDDKKVFVANVKGNSVVVIETGL